MENERKADTNKRYIIVVSTLTFVLPVIGALAEGLVDRATVFSFSLVGKWFIFSAVGLRLFVAGINQISNPGFTARDIFHIDSPESFPIVRELGFANLCFGLIGILSFFFPAWRVVSACGSGLYYGLAGLQHVLKKPVGANERFALLTDLVIFLFLLLYTIKLI